MAQFLISTSAIVTLADLGNRILSSGLSNVNIGTEFTIEELRYSADLAAAIQAGTLSVNDDGRGRSITGPVSNAIATAFVNNIFHYDDADVSEVIALTNIDELNNVTLTSPLLNGEALVYNSGSGQWENQAVAGGVTSVNSQTGVVVLDTDDISDIAATNKYFTNALARGAISIASGSTTYLGYNSGTGELSVSALAITTVDVFGTYVSLAAFVTGEYTGTEFQEGDVIILPDATGGTQTYIHNGGVAATAADFTLIQQPDLSQATVRGWFSATAPLSYDSGTGVFSLSLKANGGLVVESNTLALDLSASSITGTLDETDGGTGNNTYATGDILYASAANTLTKLTAGTAGQQLQISGGVPVWVTPAAAKRSWSWGASNSSSVTTNRFLDRHDGVPTNESPYVSWVACTCDRLSLSSASASSWTAQMFVNGTLAAQITSGGNQYSQGLVDPVAIAAGDRVSFYVSGTGVDKPSIDALFIED